MAAEEKEERDEKKRIENIKKEFHYGVAGLRERDHYMIEGVSEETLLDLPAEEQTAWLGQVEAARKRFLEVERKSIKKMRRSFESYVRLKNNTEDDDSIRGSTGTGIGFEDNCDGEL